MDYYKDKALKAKKAAERKFNAKDIAGARRKALKAQNLYPELEGICQMISTLDVYLAAETKVNGENDWYAILSVNASANKETLKQRYRNLALQLHPDKNKSLGAEGAFRLISEAWSVLSDKRRKLQYDEKRNVNGYKQQAPQLHEDHSVQTSANGFYEFAQVRKKNKRACKNQNGTSVVPMSHSSSLNTFWTSCNQCRMQYEYLRIYLNHNLLCPKCNQAFLAVEIGIPVNAVTSASQSAKQCQQNSRHGYCPGYNNSTFQGTSPAEFQNGVNLDPYNGHFHWGSYAESGGINSMTDTAFQTENFNYPKVNTKRKKHEEAKLGARREETHRSDDCASRNASNCCMGFDSNNCHTYEYDCVSFKSGKPSKRIRCGIDDFAYHGINQVENFVKSSKSAVVSEVEMTDGALADCPKSRITRQYNFSKELSQINIRQLLMEKVRLAASKKLEEWGLANQAKLGEKVKSNKKYDQKDNDRQQGAAGHAKALLQTQHGNSSAKNSPDSDNIEVHNETHTPVSIDVPDPEFYDFDKDRLERTFKGDQIWATYDSEDGMPRLYVLIQKVLSLKPFRIRMTFLTSKSNSELGPIKWVSSGYAKTCGDFRIGRYQIGETINIFSHRMRWEKGRRGVIKILPKKGDIWAVYKNWSPDWNEFTPDDIIHKYEMVEVLDDDREEQGVVVTPLVKVAGFKAVFQRHLDTKEFTRIPREEMFRFSHQVPYYMLTGKETHNSLKGCLELDPAATPVELLQIITEVKDDMSEGTQN